MQVGPLLFAILVGLSVLLAFVALGRVLGAPNPVEERLAGYGGAAPLLAEEDAAGQRRWSAANRWLAGLGMGPKLAAALSRADVPMTAAEFAALVLALVALAFTLGALRGGLLLGLLLALVVALLPNLYLRRRADKRRRAFTQQIPDFLTLMVGALRAGYGLTQSMDILTTQMPPPASVEFQRALRAISLGVPVQRALSDMAARVDSDDLKMVVTAINVQYETGGNLAQTLDTIGETVRERIRIMREIQVMTAQQRLTGTILALLPAAVGVVIFIINPDYMGQLFTPQWLWLPALALGMQLMGFLVIRRIMAIDV